LNPWEIKGNPWGTKAKFFSWLRGQLRRAWSKYPLRINYLQKKRFKIPNPKPKGRKEIWGAKCEKCRKKFPMKDIQVDHIESAGTLTEREHIQEFVERLIFIGEEAMQLLCKECHGIKTYSDRYGVTWNQAKKRKKEIARKKNLK
jgi:hypothetical protein